MTSRIIAVVLLAAFAPSLSAEMKMNPSLKKQRVERGRYLTTISACHDCHSPKAGSQLIPDPERLLSGRPQTTAPPLQGAGEIRASLDLTAWAGPWGNSYAANLTPDRETGLGARYTEALFIQAIRTGKKPEGETLSPPMPWTVYRNMTDEDLKSIYAYLRTLKPVNNAVRAAYVAASPKGKNAMR
jgi:cytochrome c553